MGDFVNFCAGVNPGTTPGLYPDALLVNAVQHATNSISIRATKQMISDFHPQYLMLDSGGYQLLSKGAIATYDKSLPVVYNKDKVNIAPIHIIQAAVELKPLIMTSLDLPVPKVFDPYLQYDEFKKKLGYNLTWMRECALLRMKHCPDIGFFIPIQCYTLGQFMTYIEKPLMDLPFDGLSLPTRNMGPAGITLFFIRFYQLSVRKVHLLSVANFTELALAAYFARNVFDWCSVDATTWRFAADMQCYLDPDDLHQMPIGDKADFQEGERPSCNCRWCSGITFTGIKNLPMIERTSFLRCHNFHVIQQACRDFYENSGDLVTLEKHLRSRGKRYEKKIDQLINALKIATYMRDADIGVLEGLLSKF
jgi:tRNA-guanine family transglycosylase